MTINEHLAASLAGNLGFVKMTLADMTDADLLTRPVPNANHPNWQIGHLINAETMMLTAGGVKMPELPANYKDMYGAKATGVDDPAQLLTKAQLLQLFEITRAASINWVKTATPEQFAAPAPERIRPIAPTMLDVAQLFIGHVAMHVGQIQVTRRKLGKPILF